MRKSIQSALDKIRRHKTLVVNFGYLSALQIFSMLLPLITLPYLIGVLGKEAYGLVIFGQAIVAYLVVLVNFGFDISATKAVSEHRDNPEKLSEIVSSVYIIKGFLFFLSLLILSVALYFTPGTDGYKLFFYLTAHACLREWLFPVWYFQGIEKMKHITLASLISGVIFLALVFLLVKQPNHYLRVPMINGLGSLVLAIFQKSSKFPPFRHSKVH